MDFVVMVLLCIGTFWLLAIRIRKNEQSLWNRGVCSECGQGWYKPFDMDSGGAMGYRCTECGDAIWLSWYKPEQTTQPKRKSTKISHIES